MMIMTVHSILAVDFPIFPRWLGKTETFGTSLVRDLLMMANVQMDIGVGSFVFSLGIISTRSYLNATSMPKFMLKNVKKSLPIIAMGMVRVIMVKGVEYPVCRSEKL
jgi:phosphatidylinositol glycan class W